MKKTIFKITLSVLAIVGLSSCLGDTNSSITTSGFAYITTTEAGQKVATVPGYGGGYTIASQVINDLNLEDCVFANFKISFDNQSASGIFTAERFDVIETYESILQPRVQVKSAPVVAEKDTLVAFSSFNTSNIMYVSTPDWGDRWAISSYSTPLTKDQKSTLEFYYDVNKQTDKEGVAVDVSKIAVVDVRLTKSVQGPGGATSSSQSAVAKFKNLRDQIMGNASGAERIIMFKYYILEKDKNVSKAVIKYDKAGVMSNKVVKE